ncbi:SLOG family protein [Ghiorsea bivora]|uniref:SLOG family protein n=1 Tax=Ghiorsea bivora TaxID=1485545 RepID=UPI000570DD8D|nr:SLOG family protein [Ghiorsea bivora]
MKLAVIGSRQYTNMVEMSAKIDGLTPSTIISGGAKGADTLAKTYATKHNINMVEHKADWKQFGRGAGIIRNRTIVESADHILAFWDGSSLGTKSSIDYARKLNKPVTIIYFDSKA